MCGILGFVGQVPEGKWNETHRLLEALFLASEHRGRDATGFVAATAPFMAREGGQVLMDKRPLTASEFVRLSGPWRGLRHRRCEVVLGHVRWATHGSPLVNRNNHPHATQGGLFLVKNGVLADHEADARARGLDLETDCDSELVLRVVEAAPSPARGLQVALQELTGSMAVAIYDQKTGVVWLGRNAHRPLWIAKLKDDKRWFFASTSEILLAAFTAVLGRHAEGRLEMLMPVAEGVVHTLSPLGVLLALPAPPIAMMETD